MLTACRTTVVTAIVVLTLGTAAFSQTSSQSPSTTAQKAGQMNMSMDDMMKQCREHCSTAAKQMDGMMKKMNDARASNDPAKMRAALDEAQKPMADMKQHMNMCMNMMDMMHNMGGMKKK